jgi:hypothetical protein
MHAVYQLYSYRYGSSIGNSAHANNSKLRGAKSPIIIALARCSPGFPRC